MMALAASRAEAVEAPGFEAHPGVNAGRHDLDADVARRALAVVEVLELPVAGGVRRMDIQERPELLEVAANALTRALDLDCGFAQVHARLDAIVAEFFGA